MQRLMREGSYEPEREAEKKQVGASQLTFADVARAARYGTREEAEQVAAAYRAQRERRVEQTALQRRYEQRMYELEEQRQRTRYYEKTAPTEWKESVAFYVELGYPLYAGRYEPFDVPKGYKVREITETAEGLQVSFESTSPKGLAETMLGWALPKMGPMPGLIEGFMPLGTRQAYRQLSYTFTRAITGKEPHPLAGPAGIVAAVESPVYTIGQLFGLQTPRPPPTYIGGLVGKGVGVVTGVPSTEFEKTLEYGPEYAFGTVVGDILISVGTGKAVGWGWKKIRGVKAVKVTGAEEAEKAVAKHGVLEAERVTGLKLTTERVPYKYSKWLKEMERYVTPTKVAFAGKEKVVVKGGKEFFLFGKPTETLRGAGIYVEAAKAWKQPSLLRRIGAKFGLVKITPPKVYEQFFMVAGKETILPTAERLTLRQFTAVQFFGKVDPQVYLRYIKVVPVHVAQKWYPQMGGVTVQQLMKLPVKTITVAPKLVSVTTPSLAIPKLLGAGAIIGVKAIRQPSRRIKKIPVLGLFPREEAKPIQPLFPKFEEGTRIEPVLRLPSAQKLAPTQVPIQKVKAQPKQVPAFKIPTIPIVPPTFTVPPYWRLPRGGRDASRLTRGLFGAWGKRTHPIAGPREVARMFGLYKPKRKVKGRRKVKPKKKRRKKKQVKKREKEAIIWFLRR